VVPQFTPLRHYRIFTTNGARVLPFLRRRVRRQDIARCGSLAKRKKRKRGKKGTCGDARGAKQLVVNVLGTSYYGTAMRRLLSLMHRFALMATRDPLGVTLVSVVVKKENDGCVLK